jgi:hypothetical protein
VGSEESVRESVEMPVCDMFIPLTRGKGTISHHINDKRLILSPNIVDNMQGRMVNKVYFDGILVDLVRYRPGGGCVMRSVTCYLLPVTCCHHIIHYTHTHTHTSFRLCMHAE